MGAGGHQPVNPPPGDKKKHQGEGVDVCNQIEDAIRATVYAEAIMALRLAQTDQEADQ